MFRIIVFILSFLLLTHANAQEPDFSVPTTIEKFDDLVLVSFKDDAEKEMLLPFAKPLLETIEAATLPENEGRPIVQISFAEKSEVNFVIDTRNTETCRAYFGTIIRDRDVFEFGVLLDEEIGIVGSDGASPAAIVIAGHLVSCNHEAIDNTRIYTLNSVRDRRQTRPIVKLIAKLETRELELKVDELKDRQIP